MLRLRRTFTLLLATSFATGCTPAAPRTAGVLEREGPRSADSTAVPDRSPAEWAALDAAAVAQLSGGFRTRLNGSGSAVVESVAGDTTLLHALLLGEPVIAVRWFGEAWEPAPARLRRVSREGVVDEVASPPGAAWRVRLTGPAGFPLGDYAGNWTHGPGGPAFAGRSAGGAATPPVPGGGGGVWLPSAALRVEPVVGRWWIEDAAGREVWSRASLPATVEAPAEEHAAFWAALAAGLDRRLAAGPVRVAAEPWAAAFGAAAAEDPEAAAASVLDAVLRQ